MTHWIVAPVILPALLAPVMAMAMRHDLPLQRTFGLAGHVSLLAIAIWLTLNAADGTIRIYELGAWRAPFGIVLVLDRLSALMLLLTSILGVVVTIYAIGSGWDRRGWHFHSLFAFQMMGVNGAFLTGDAFNLFVFFEVLLIASYGLMIHSGGAYRLRAGLQYVVMNLAGSTLFLFALGTLYAVLGTLNMADMAEKAANVPPEDAALLATGAVLLLIVFAVKAAAFPVQFWLPATYASAPAPVAALFAIMTKVGAYAIIRIYTLVFGAGTPELNAFIEGLLMPAACLTLVIGAIGVLGAQRLERTLSFSVLASMGTLLIAISLFTEAGLSAALYYMVHSTFAAAGLFLVADLVRQAEGEGGRPHGLVVSYYFAAAIAMAGMPPLTGFLGKIYVLQAVGPEAGAAWIWAIILISSLVIILGLTRMGTALFWKPAPDPAQPPLEDAPQIMAPPALAAVAAALPLAILVAMTLASGPVASALTQTSAQLIDRPAYIAAVLSPPSHADDGLVRGGGAYSDDKKGKTDDKGHGKDAHDGEDHGGDSHADDAHNHGDAHQSDGEGTNEEGGE